MMEHARDVTLVVNGDELVILASRSAVRLGWAPADLVGSAWRHLLDTSAAPAAALESFERDGSSRVDVRVRRRDGSTWDAAMVGYSLDVHPGGPMFVVVLSDARQASDGVAA